MQIQQNEEPRCCIKACKTLFQKQNLPILLRCGHLACKNCLVEVKQSQEGEKWITFCCKDCNQEDELDIEYHLKYHEYIIQAFLNEHCQLKPKIEGALFFCASHDNQKITTYCKKCDSYLCFECQMDHFDHAKGNFQNAAEEILFQKISKDSEQIQKNLNELTELYLQYKKILNKQETIEKNLLCQLFNKAKSFMYEKQGAEIVQDSQENSVFEKKFNKLNEDMNEFKVQIEELKKENEKLVTKLQLESDIKEQIMIECKADQQGFASMKKQIEEMTLSLEQISKENEKLKSSSSTQISIDKKQIMQTIYNNCPVLDYQKGSQNMIDTFKSIGPVNIEEEIKKSGDQFTFDEKEFYIGYIHNYFKSQKCTASYIGMIDSESNLPSGFGRLIYSDGEAFDDSFLKDGKKHGIRRQIKINGAYLVEYFVNGLREGEQKKFNKRGILKEQLLYQNGEIKK